MPEAVNSKTTAAEEAQRRLEGWHRRISVRPSFETLATRAPQDEAGGIDDHAS